MIHSEFGIELHQDRLCEALNKKSGSLKIKGLLLESLEIIRQLSKERDAAVARIPDNLPQLVARDTPAAPVQESLADRNCPACAAGLCWDALNDSIENAPAFCSQCGQRLDWSKEIESNT